MSSRIAVSVAVAVAAIVAAACGPRTIIVGTAPGGRSLTYLRESPAKKLVVEVTPVGARRPNEAALSLLARRIQENADKPGGVEVVIDSPVEPIPVTTSSVVVRNAKALADFETANRKVPDSSDTVVLYVSYVDGVYAEDPRAIGVSYCDHGFAIFKDAMDSPSLEGPALVHELGHQLGLVNGATKMQEPHADPAHVGHCTNQRCVMFWSLEFRGKTTIVPDDYDAACKEDLRAARLPEATTAAAPRRD